MRTFSVVAGFLLLALAGLAWWRGGDRPMPASPEATAEIASDDGASVRSAAPVPKRRPAARPSGARPAAPPVPSADGVEETPSDARALDRDEEERALERLRAEAAATVSASEEL
jgi:hypothetical protein